MRIKHFPAVLFLFSLTSAQAADETSILPGTQPLTWEGDLSTRMMDGLHRFIELKIAGSLETRHKYWNRDLSSSEAYERSIAPNRDRFMRMLGILDERMPVRMERFGDDQNPSLVSETDGYRVFQVRWPVLTGVSGEGLLLEPKSAPRGQVVAVPDADQTPEQITGLAPGAGSGSQFARRLAENGFRVIVPVLIDRS